MSHPVKRFTTYEEQISQLQSRGMEVDEALATQWLQAVGYYRLSGYWYTAREVVGTKSDGNRKIPVRGDRFVPGTSFADIAALYEFDRKLRTQIHDGLERVEVAVRNAIAHTLGSSDPLALYHRDTFRRPSAGDQFHHYGLLTTISSRVDRALRSPRGNEHITHNVDKYGVQLATWVVADVLDFGDASKIFSGLDTGRQTEIANHLGIDISPLSLTPSQRKAVSSAHPLGAWLRQLSILRNKCAHHARVWNCTLVPAGTAVIRQLPGLASLQRDQSERVFGALTVIGKLLEVASPASSWIVRTRELLDHGLSNVPAVTADSVGATDDWSSNGVWLAS